MSPFLLFVKQEYGKICNPKNALRNVLLFLLLVVTQDLCSYSFYSFFVVTKLGLPCFFIPVFEDSFTLNPTFR